MVAEWVSTVRRWPSIGWLPSFRWTPSVGRTAEYWASLTERRSQTDGRNACADVIQRAATVRYFLGRGRRAREAGRFEDACSYARRAIDVNPGNPWSHALLGQCLMRLRHPDLVEARRAFERACALDPSNGYFVRLLLEVLDAQGDARAREDVLAWAWWSGAPVERWLPDGPRQRKPLVHTPETRDAPSTVRPSADLPSLPPVQTRDPVAAGQGVLA